MARLFDILLSPVVFLGGVIGAILRTLYWGLVVTPAVAIVGVLVSVGSVPRPVVPLLATLGGRGLHSSLGDILGRVARMPWGTRGVKEVVPRGWQLPGACFEYDPVGDTIYIELDDEAPWADNWYATDDGVIVRLFEGRIIGLTIRKAQHFMGELLLLEQPN